MPPPSVHPAASAAGAETNRRLSKVSKLSEMLMIQATLMSDIRDPMVSVSDRAAAVRAWDVIEERIRVYRMRLKPGSINMSQPAIGVRRIKRAQVVDIREIARLMEAEPDVTPPAS